MTLPLWGSLEKAQDDAQTIEQAIDAAIIEHENDPTAHLGAGESLQSHKSEEIIDHPALSIVPDKFSNEKTFLFIPLVPHNTELPYNCVVTDMVFFLEILQTTGSGDGEYILEDLIIPAFGYDGGDQIVDFFLRSFSTSGTWLHTIIFSWGKVEVKDGYYRVGYYTTTWNYSSWIAVTNGINLRFRFFYNSFENMLYVYLKDVEVFSVSYTLPSTKYTLMFDMLNNRGTSTYSVYNVGNLNVWLEGM